QGRLVAEVVEDRARRHAGPTGHVGGPGGVVPAHGELQRRRLEDRGAAVGPACEIGGWRHVPRLGLTDRSVKRDPPPPSTATSRGGVWWDAGAPRPPVRPGGLADAGRRGVPAAARRRSRQSAASTSWDVTGVENIG